MTAAKDSFSKRYPSGRTLARYSVVLTFYIRSTSTSEQMAIDYVRNLCPINQYNNSFTNYPT